VRNLDPLNLQIAGKCTTGADPAKNERFQEVFANFVKGLEGIGWRIEAGNLDVAGKSTDVLALVHASR
jgi:hypothetical protein